MLPLWPNQSMQWGLRDIRQTSPFWLSRYLEWNRGWDSMAPGSTVLGFAGADRGLLAFLGVKYLAVPHGEPLREGFALAHQSWPVDVWEITGAVRRARVIYGWSRCDDSREAAVAGREAVKEGRAETWAAVGGLAPPQGVPRDRPASEVRWLEDSSDRLSLKVSSTEDGLLVLSDSYHPGWRATVDGRAAPVFPAMGAFRAVSAPKGTHVIAMRFDSRSFTAGAVVSALSWLGALGYLLYLGFAGGLFRLGGPRSLPSHPGD